ncbi:MAG: hypothetical protein Q8R44_12455 [Novosphingobium sp.]|nr:hypothetical protein [Novosphingobium sp.]
MPNHLVLLSAATLTLSACARPAPVAAEVETDPAVAQAVMAPILTDPDLVSLDRRFAVMSDPGPLESSLPPDDFAPQTIAAARAEAAALMRGVTEVEVAEGEVCTACSGPLLADRVGVLGEACAEGLNENLDWSLRLPADLPIYPKAHLREAVGREGGACPLRGASFTAPVPAGQVLAFYRAIATRAGYTLSRAGNQVLISTRKSSRMAVIVHPQPGGISHFDLLVTG